MQWPFDKNTHTYTHCFAFHRHVLGAAGYVKQAESSNWHHMRVEEVSRAFAQGAAAGLYPTNKSYHPAVAT